MIVDELIRIKLNNTNIEHFKSLGYEVSSRYGEIIEVKSTDLSIYSHVKVRAVCNLCGNQILISNSKHTRSILGRGEYLCSPCSKGKFSLEEVRAMLEGAGMFLVSTEYKNNKSPIQFVCRTHPNTLQKMCISDFRKGARCKLCTGGDYNKWRRKVRELTTVQYLRQCTDGWKAYTKDFWCDTCVISKNQSKRNHVHHIIKPFKEITNETFQVTQLEERKFIKEYSKEELELLTNTFNTIHKSYGIGIVMSPELHYKFHAKYGKQENLEDFAEFWEEHSSNRVTC